MRPRSGLAVAGAAVMLGALTGLFLVPGSGAALLRSGPQPTATASDTASASRTPGPTPSPTPAPSAHGSGPVTERDLVPVRAFTQAGLTVEVYPQNGNTMPESPVTECTGERETGARTLSDLTGRDPAVMGTWSEPSTTNTALEVLAVAETPELAESYARRLVAAQTVCQDEPPGHFVYGSVHTEDVPRGSSARWLGRWSDARNETGRAPDDSEPCGGVVVTANGTHFAVLEVLMCADSDAMGVLAVAAAKQLG